MLNIDITVASLSNFVVLYAGGGTKAGNFGLRAAGRQVKRLALM